MPRTEIKAPVKDILLGGGVISVLLLASLIFPFFGSFFSIFIPIPILVYYGRLGRTQGLMVAIVGVLIAHLTASALKLPFNSIVLIQFALLGVLMAESIARESSVEKTIIIPAVSLFVITLLVVILKAIEYNTSLSTIVHQYFVATMNDTLKIYRAMGIPEDQVGKIEESSVAVIAVFTRIASALFLCITVIIVWVNLIVGKKIFQRWGLSFPDFGDLTLWRSPEQLVWVLIACGTGLLIPVEFIKTVAMNGILVMLLIYFFQGISIVSYFFKKYKVPPVIRIVSYFLLGIQQLMLVLVVGAGLFDLWFDFRKITPGRSKHPGSLEDGG